MPSEKAPYTSLLKDESKSSLGALDLFDRVINLKLTTMNGDEYVIRSDYEMYYPNLESSIASADIESFKELNTCYIRKCQYKPSIKIQYKRVSMTTPVSVDIFVSNFFMLDKNGKVLRNFNNITNELFQVEVALGYFGQFKSAMKATEANSLTVSQLFDFNPDNLKGHGITVITMSNVEYTQTDKLPPDMTLHIHGYTGNLYAPSLVTSDNSIPSNYDDVVKNKNNQAIDFSKISVTGAKAFNLDTVIGTVFFNYVSKNWVRTGTGLPEDVKAQLMTKEQRRDYYSELTINDTLSEENAKKYGVIVYFSKGARKFAQEFDKSLKESGEYDTFKISVGSSPNAWGKANAVLSTLGNDKLRLVDIPTTGNLFLYLEEEMQAIEDMLEETSLKNVYKNEAVSLYWKDKLPAVYNITTDALCTITCPFFFFINPFQKFYFKSAYALGGIVAYYANFSPQEDEFYALWQTISFATVEDINECTIVCTGKKSSS